MFTKRIIVFLSVVFVISFSLGYLGSIEFLRDMNKKIQIREVTKIKNENTILNSENFAQKNASLATKSIIPVVAIDSDGQVRFIN